MIQTFNTVNQTDVENAINFETYFSMFRDWVDNGKTSGTHQSEKMAEYTKMNFHRLSRWMKTYEPSQETKSLLNNISQKYYWIILTEAWCGDASQCVPILEKIAQSSDNIKSLYLFRDENLKIMDAYLTNGGRAIPKLICLKQDSLKEVFNWGPRPIEAQEFVLLNKDNPAIDYKVETHKWYAKNKGVAIEQEIFKLVQENLL